MGGGDLGGVLAGTHDMAARERTVTKAMARKLATPCSNPTCPEVTGERYCEKHRREKWRGDDNRPSAAERGYDSQWQKVRERYVSRHPICEHCEERGEVTPADVVDHITPLADGGPRLDTENLQSLCHSCHNRKHARS